MYIAKFSPVAVHEDWDHDAWEEDQEVFRLSFLVGPTGLKDEDDPLAVGDRRVEVQLAGTHPDPLRALNPDREAVGIFDRFELFMEVETVVGMGDDRRPAQFDRRAVETWSSVPPERAARLLEASARGAADLLRNEIDTILARQRMLGALASISPPNGGAN